MPYLGNDPGKLGTVLMDSFTGNGSTVAFTLGREPPNSDALIVTVDGVVQHPTGAWSISANILTFSTAPDSSAEIRVWHLSSTASGGLTSLVADTTPQLGGQLDVNGNAIGDGTLELLKFAETGSAVNELTITNAATGNPPALSATGGDANINLKLAGKGTGGLEIGATATTASKLILAEDTDNGAHTITVAAPAAVTGDITLTLPDGDGDNEQFLQTNGSGVLSWAAAAGGLTEADSWALTVGFVDDAQPIDENLDRLTTDGFGLLGTGMSESSGIFTFPSTGYWAVLAMFDFRKAGDSDYNWGRIMVSVNADGGNTYSNVSCGASSMTQHDSANMMASAMCYSLVDVTSTAAVKVRFDVVSRDAATSVNGGGGYNSTSFHFLRLGDT